MRKIVFINQTIGDLFIDVIESFSKLYSDRIIISGKSFSKRNLDKKSSLTFDPILDYDRSSSLKRIFTWFWGGLQIIIKVRFKYRNEDLFIVSNPPTAFFVPLFCKNNYSLLVYDIYPDILHQANVLDEQHFLIRWWKKKNRQIYKNASTIYTISEGMAECVSQYVDKSRIEVIPNWADTSLIKPIDKEENLFLKQYSLNQKFIVLYSGNIGDTHNVEVLVDIADLLKSHTDIQFVIIGEGGKKKEVENKIKQKSLTNCLLLPFQPKEMLSYTLPAADIGVITLDLNFSQLSVPSKTYNMMAAGSSLLCMAGQNSELASIVDKYQLGKVYEPSQAKEMANHILELKEDPERLRLYKENSRKASLDFTPENSLQYIDKYKINTSV